VETEKIGMREFRENLAGYLESGKPLAITRHGETLGFYIPAQKRTGRAGPAPTGEELAPPAGPKRVRCARFLRSVAPG
jgi:antitoxin (DNA-binding transcriptional repressor) of toxin-antitoxin stability system